MQKEQLGFGQGSFVGAIMSDPAFFELSVHEQALVLGWADGCPVAPSLTDPDNTAPGRGPEAMLGRYAEVNFWFGEIIRTVTEINPGLAKELVTPIDRLPGEPVGKYEPASVPASHQKRMEPMGTLPGFALSRILIEQLGSEELPQEERQNRLITALEELEDAAAYAKSPLELLALFGERLVVFGDTEPEKVLKHALSQGWLEEHNGDMAIDEFKILLSGRALRLQHFYINLSPEEKAKLKLA